MKEQEINESVIAKAGLSGEEKKVIRVRYCLSTAGSRTKRWVNSLNNEKYLQLLSSAQEKIQQALRTQGAGE